MGTTCKDKLRILADEYSTTVNELLEDYVVRSVAPGICINEGCTYTAEYEPTQQAGWCEECQTWSVVSALVLAGVF